MNERIKKILLDVKSPVGHIGNWGRVQWADEVYPQLGDDLYAGVDLEKFAELIVRECVSKLDGIGVIDRDSRTIAMKVISDHFGVEE